MQRMQAPSKGLHPFFFAFRIRILHLLDVLCRLPVHAFSCLGMANCDAFAGIYPFALRKRFFYGLYLMFFGINVIFVTTCTALRC